MSYGLEFTDPARSDLRQLEPWLQEETLDEIDLLTGHPPVKSRRTGDRVCDFVRRRENRTYYVFITIWPDERKNVLRIQRIGLHVRSDDPSQ